MKVAFLVPTYSGHPCLEFQISALNTQDLLHSNNIDSIWRYLGGDPYVHKARNKLASEFLTSNADADFAFFIDDDVGWPAEAVLRLVTRNEPVICGIYPMKSNEGEYFPVELLFEKQDDGTLTPIYSEGLYSARLCPTGFMRIRRDVLEAAAGDSGIYPDKDPIKDEAWCWDIFRTGFVANEPNSKTGNWWGEDYFFSVMVKNLGFDIWVDADIDFSHRGSKAWKANFSKSLKAKIKDFSKPKVIDYTSEL